MNEKTIQERKNYQLKCALLSMCLKKELSWLDNAILAESQIECEFGLARIKTTIARFDEGGVK